MKKILLFISLLIGIMASAQSVYDSTRSWQPVNGDGFIYKNIQFNGALIFANDTPRVKYAQNAISFKSGLPYYKPALSNTWVLFSSAGGSGTVTGITTSGGSPLFTTTITPGAVPNIGFTISPQLAYTIYGNNAGSPAAPSFFTPSLTGGLFQNQGTTTTFLKGNAAGNLSFSAINLTTDVTGTLPPANGGYVNPMTTLGDLIRGGASGVQTRLAGNTTTVIQALTSTGDGVNATAPAYLPILPYSASANPLTGNHIALNSTGGVTDVVTSSSLTDGVVGNGCQVTSAGSGLTVNVSPCVYNIGGTQYNYPGGTVTPGTADPTNPRFDGIYVNTSNSAGVAPGTAQVNPEIPTVDATTQLFLTAVFIDAAATTLTQIGQVIVRDVNYAAGEWFMSRTATIDSIYATNPFHSTLSVRLTAATNNQYFQYNSRAGALFSKAAYNTLLLYVRNNSTFNAARNLIVSLWNGVTQVGVNLNLTTYGYVKTTTGVYQTIAIPMSAFTGADAFTAIRITNTGTGGTVDVQFDYVQLQSGISNGNGTNVVSTYRKVGSDSVFNVYGNGSKQFAFRDSIGSGSSSGAAVDSILGVYSTATFPGASIPSGWASTAGGATITYSTGLHISGGSGFYANNNVRSTSVSGSNNYTYSMDFNVVTKPTDNIGGLWIGRFGTSSNATHLYVAFKRSDATHAYLNMRVVNGSGNGSTFDSTATVALADGNNYRVTVSQSQNTIYFRLARLSAGVEVTGDIVDKLYTIPINTTFQLPSMGDVAIGSLGGSYVVTPVTETVNDLRSTNLVMMGTSITQGYMPSNPQSHYLSMAFKDARKKWANFGSGGALTSDAASLLTQVYALRPTYVGLEYGVNDTYTDIRTYLNPVIDSLQAHGITPFILKDFTVASKDTILYNLASEQGIKIIDPGLFMTAGYFVDGVHPNDLGNAFIAKYCKAFGSEIFGTTGGIDQYRLRALADVKFTGLANGDGLFYNSTTGQFENGTGSSSFIKNTTSVQTSANFYIDGYGRATGFHNGGISGNQYLHFENNLVDGEGIYLKNNSGSNFFQLFVEGTNGHSITDWPQAVVMQNTAGITMNAYGGAFNVQTNSSNQTRLKVDKFGQVQVGYPAVSTLCTACAFEVKTTIATSKPYPAMTTAQRNAIASVQAGDGVYCSDCTASDASTGVVTIWNGSAWKNMW